MLKKFDLIGGGNDYMGGESVILRRNPRNVFVICSPDNLLDVCGNFLSISGVMKVL